MPRKLKLAAIGLASFTLACGVTRYGGRQPDGSRQIHRAAPNSSEAPPGMVWIPGGEFRMGTDLPCAWPDERPAHLVKVRGFGFRCVRSSHVD
ncbi:MAG TPA: SUMF1/EgtB/PvdO family nonheme iron enzyme [Pirellulales bacterium]|nr:SUMF1/EgtB/PvdO family nonheme iron enzyme [Pirellulales bacterium]